MSKDSFAITRDLVAEELAILEKLRTVRQKLKEAATEIVRCEKRKGRSK